MVAKVNQKLSSRSVAKADLETFIDRELVPTVEKIRLLTSALLDLLMSGEGSPEGVVTANPATLYQRTDGAPGTMLYRKDSGVGTNTGWTAVL